MTTKDDTPDEGEELHEYDTELNGYPTTVRLTEKAAKDRGFTKKSAGKPATKAVTPTNK